LDSLDFDSDLFADFDFDLLFFEAEDLLGLLVSLFSLFTFLLDFDFLGLI